MTSNKNRGIRDIREFRSSKQLAKGDGGFVFKSAYSGEDKQLIKHCDKIVLTHPVEKEQKFQDEHIPYERIKAFKEAFNAEFDIKPRLRKRKIYWNQLLRIAAVILFFVNVSIVFFYGKGDNSHSSFSPYQLSSLELSGLAVNTDYRFEKGMEYYQQGKYLQSIDMLEEIPPGHPKMQMVLFVMANSYMALEDQQVAIVVFEKLLSDPDWNEYRAEATELRELAYNQMGKAKK